MLRRRATTMCVLAGAAALTIGAGCGGREDDQAAGTVPTVPTSPAVVALTDSAPESSAGREAVPTRTQPLAAPARLDEMAFWHLIADTRRAAGNDTGRQSELLEERLTQLPAHAIVDFARIRRQLDQRAYTWSLWAAAALIEDGCSDDCFRDFRAYLISLGPGPYRHALQDPDSLASVAQDAEQGNWENADNVAPDAYSSVTGEDYPLDDSDLSGRPRGTPFDENDQAALARRYPRLAARFR
jgi:Protein of unknown function (DUF4240)